MKPVVLDLQDYPVSSTAGHSNCRQSIKQRMPSIRNVAEHQSLYSIANLPKCERLWWKIRQLRLRNQRRNWVASMHAPAHTCTQKRLWWSQIISSKNIVSAGSRAWGC